MKRTVGLIVAVTTFFLLVTKSLYVERIELYVIIVSLSLIAIVFNLTSKQWKKSGEIVASSAIVGSVFFWVFALTDLIADHFMYFLPSGNEDGRPLPLVLKIQEFSDDLFIASITALIPAVLISFLSTTLFAKVITKRT
ncbi:hypothetical protein [Paenibacillus beijingensis]|uniref:DUF4199 domain-containing protein n=1 Tax=Paenibacillus beijingensis TaxID=1126833 RepID=A0A0D5NLG0_9BACL|nr:hypothetical protein [Paenibacillus beijingensis]AJY75758.1 hypothetical protein VN24_15860 [Paenibacillus beijingensis]